MNRREALKRIAALSGGALSLSTVSGLLAGCSGYNDNSAQTLTKSQSKLVAQLAECIIPATDTPGAKAANVNLFINHMLTNWNTKKERDCFLKGLKNVTDTCKKRYKKKFVHLSNENQISIIQELQQKASEKSRAQNPKPFFYMLKELTLVGYYTSKIGASKELNLGLIPGYYDGCIPYSSDDRAWA